MSTPRSWTSILAAVRRAYFPYLPLRESSIFTQILFDSTGHARDGMSLSTIEKVSRLLRLLPSKPVWEAMGDVSRLISSELSPRELRRFQNSLLTDGICYTGGNFENLEDGRGTGNEKTSQPRGTGKGTESEA
jgi:hypothetical protein